MYNPQQYSRSIGLLVNATKNVFEKHANLLEWNSEPESILDHGIGDGKMTNEVILPLIPRNIKEYVGADISNTMLETAKQTVKHDKLKFVQLDAATRELPNEMRNRFHHIFSNLMLHHVVRNDIG